MKAQRPRSLQIEGTSYKIARTFSDRNGSSAARERMTWKQGIFPPANQIIFKIADDRFVVLPAKFGKSL